MHSMYRETGFLSSLHQTFFFTFPGPPEREIGWCIGLRWRDHYQD